MQVVQFVAFCPAQAVEKYKVMSFFFIQSVAQPVATCGRAFRAQIVDLGSQNMQNKVRDAEGDMWTTGIATLKTAGAL